MGNIKLITSITFLILGIFLIKDLFWSIIFSLAGYIISSKIIKNYQLKQKEIFESQLVDVIQMLSGFIKAGLILSQAIENVIKETDPPVSVYFKDLLSQIQLGIPFEVALTEISKKINSKEFNFAVLSMKIAHKYGGNLAQNLKRIADILRERRKIQNKIKAITSQARLSSKMVTFIPFLLLVILNFLEPDIFGIMFKTLVGKLVILLCLILSYIGNWFISKITEIDM